MAYASAFAVTTKVVLAGMLLALPQKAPCSSVWSRRAETESSFLLILPCISLIAVPMPSLIAWVPWLSFADASVISLVASPSWAYPAWIFARPSLMPARPWLNCALALLALSSVALAVAVACWAEARFAFASAVAWISASICSSSIPLVSTASSLATAAAAFTCSAFTASSCCEEASMSLPYVAV